VPPWAISFGAPTAPVTLIELYDLHCIYCALAHERLDPLYRQLLAEGALRLVFVDLIVHPDALEAHRRLHCAYRQLGEGAYDLLTELYGAYLRGGAEGQLELLRRYECANAPAEAEDCGGVDASMCVLSGAEGCATRRSARASGVEHFAGAEMRCADGRRVHSGQATAGDAEGAAVLNTFNKYSLTEVKTNHYVP
jgi:hypothetical protein